MNAKVLTKVAVVLILIACTGPVHAAIDMYLKIGDIDGESTDIGFEDWSDILGYNISAKRSTSTSGGSRGAATLSPMTIVKEVDKASPLFFGGLLLGQVYPSAMVDARHSSDGEKYVLWEFENVILTSYETNGTPSGASETVAFDYEVVTYTYWPQTSDGKLGVPVMFTFNKETNKSSFTGNLAEFQFVTALGAPIPEPSSVLILGIGLIGIAVYRRRSSHHSSR